MFSQPTVGGDLLFIGSCAGKFYALNKATGKEVWSYDTRADGGPRSFHGNPLFYQERVVIATDHGCEGYVYAFNQRSGKLLWKTYASGPSTGFARIDNSIVFGTRGDEWISIQLDTGKENWRSTPDSQDTQCEIRSQPVTDGGNVFFVTHDGTIHALDGASGREAWKYSPPAPITTSLFAYRHVLYFGTRDGRVYGINPSDTKIVVQVKTFATPIGRFVSGNGPREFQYVFGTKKTGNTDGVLIALGDDFELLWAVPSESEWSSEVPHLWNGMIVAGDCRGNFKAYHDVTGALLWNYHVKGCIRSFGHDQTTLYIGTQEGAVYAYQPSSSSR